MTHDRGNGRLSSLDALPSFQRRLVLLELEAHPAEVDERRLARWLDAAPETVVAARAEAWRRLGEEPARLARLARDRGLLIPLTAPQAARCEGPWPELDETDVRATARRVVTAWR
jgi:hypothetical protein